MVCCQEFWFFLPGFDIQPEQSCLDNPARRKLVQGSKIWPVDKAITTSWAIWVWFMQGAGTPCQLLPFWVALRQSVLWHALFYIAALSIIVFLGFHQTTTWVPAGNLMLFALQGLTWTLWLPLLGALGDCWSLVWGQDSPGMASSHVIPEPMWCVGVGGQRERAWQSFCWQGSQLPFFQLF